MAGQSIGDRITAAQHTIIGSDMSKSVCKATTHEIMGPKKKHLDYLNALTREQNINIPELADLLIERTKLGKWVVVFKSLITTHHLMCYGNERFIQHLASRNTLFNLTNFIDKSGVQGYDMSAFIRRYAKYLNQKAVSYRTVAYDFTRVKRGKDNGVLRTQPTEKLLKTLPTLQLQLDTLLEFHATANELTNGVVNSAFMLLFKDLIRLFACYNDGIINLLEKYFDMKKHHCKEALDLYKKFLTRMEKVSEFLKVAEQVGIDKGDIPDLTQAPNSLLDALEQHFATLEGKKGNVPSKPSTTTSAQVKAFSAVSSSFDEIDTKDKEASLREEEEQMMFFKQKIKEQQEAVQAKPTTNGAVTAPVTTQQPVSSFSIDLLSTDSVATTAPTSTSLFDLDNFSSSPAGQTNVFPQQNAFGQMNSQPFGMQAQQPFGQPDMSNSQMFLGASTMNQQPVMGGTSTPNLFPATTATPFESNNAMPFQGDLLTPTVFGQTTAQPANSSVSAMSNQQAPVSGDLDSSLANVVANLTVGGSKANQNFQPKTEKKLTGGMNFQPQFQAGTTSITQPVQMGGGSAMMPQMMPMQMPMYNQGMMGMQPVMQPNMYGQHVVMQQQMNMRQLNPNNPFGSM